MDTMHAFRTGLGRALAYWQAWLAAFLASLVSAAALALLPALGLVNFARRTAIDEVLEGIRPWLFLDLLAAPALGADGGDISPLLALTPFILLMVMPLAAWVSSALVYGGVLLTYVEAPQPFSWRRFGWGCWHWLGAFLLLGLVQGLVFLVGFVPAAILAISLGLQIGAWAGWAAAFVLGLVFLYGLALFESARVMAVAGGTRNIFQALGRGFAFVTYRKPLSVLGLYLLGALLVLLVQAVFRLGLMPLLPLAVWPLALVVQQGFVLARLWARLARLAGNVVMVRGEGAEV